MLSSTILMIAVGLILAHSMDSIYWRTQRDDENITISLQYINTTQRKESVQISVLFDQRSHVPQRNLSLSFKMDTLVHSVVGPDELLMLIEGPSLQATIGTVGKNLSHQTGSLTIPIAGLYNLKVVRTRQWYRAIDEAYVGHPEMNYDVLIDVFVNLRQTMNPENDSDDSQFSGYWMANDKKGLYLRLPHNSSTGVSSSSSSSSNISYEIWHSDEVVKKHFFHGLPAMYTHVRLSKSAHIVIDGPVNVDLTHSNTSITTDFVRSNDSIASTPQKGRLEGKRLWMGEDDFAQSNDSFTSHSGHSVKLLSCALETSNFHWVWTKHLALPSQPFQSKLTSPNEASQSNPNDISQWFNKTAAEALLMNAYFSRRTLLFFGDSQMRTFIEALIGWICNLVDPHQISLYVKFSLPLPKAQGWPTFRPIQDVACAARLLNILHYVPERYCNPSKLPSQSSGQYIALVNCGHHPASGNSGAGMGHWPLAKYKQVVHDFMVMATGPVKEDRPQSNSSVKSDHVQSNLTAPIQEVQSNLTAPVQEVQSNQTSSVQTTESNTKNLGYDPVNMVWMESVPFPFRNDRIVNESGDWRTLHRILLYNQVANHVARTHKILILPANSLLPLVDKMCDNAHYTAKGALMPMIQAYLAILHRTIPRQSNYYPHQQQMQRQQQQLQQHQQQEKMQQLEHLLKIQPQPMEQPQMQQQQIQTQPMQQPQMQQPQMQQEQLLQLQQFQIQHRQKQQQQLERAQQYLQQSSPPPPPSSSSLPQHHHQEQHSHGHKNFLH